MGPKDNVYHPRRRAALLSLSFIKHFLAGAREVGESSSYAFRLFYCSCVCARSAALFIPLASFDRSLEAIHFSFVQPFAIVTSIYGWKSMQSRSTLRTRCMVFTV